MKTAPKKPVQSAKIDRKSAQRADLPPKVRETRASAASKLQRHTFAFSEVRVVKNDDGTSKLTGYAAVYNQPSTPLKTAKGKTFIEQIAPGAFTETLKEGRDIPLLYGHDSSKVLARTGSGTLTLREDSKGLAFEAALPDTTLGRDVVADVNHKNIKGMSFGFDAPVDEWAKGDDGVALRTLKTVELGEVSATPFPAYEGTSVDVRSIDMALAELEGGEKRCGGYYASDGGGIRSVCRSAQMACRDAHDHLENAIHTISTRSNDPNEHEQRAMRDMASQIRATVKKAAEVRSALKELDPNDDPEDEDDPDADEDQGGTDNAADDERALRARNIRMHAAEIGMSMDAVAIILGETRVGAKTPKEQTSAK